MANTKRKGEHKVRPYGFGFLLVRKFLGGQCPAAGLAQAV